MTAIRGFTLVTHYTELPGAKLWVDKGKVRGQRVFRLLDYNNLANFLAALAGGFETTSGTTVYNVPHQFRSNVLVWCQGVETEGIGIPTRSSGEEYFAGGARVTATYETLDYDPRTRSGGSSSNQPPGVYITESRSTGGQLIELNKFSEDGVALWQYASGEVIGGDAPALVKVEAEGEYRLTLHYVPSFGQSTVNGLIGKINNATFPTTSAMGGYAQGTLLFLGDESEREFTADAVTIAFQKSLRFSYKPTGWNKIYNPGTGVYSTVELISDPTKTPYTEADFSPLLT